MSKTSIDKMIQLNHVKFGYSDTEVLDEINLTINEGEYVVLTGENGSGKSTLMRLILGELKPDEGEISPSSGFSSPKIRRISVLFPLPFSPVNTTYSPSLIVRLISSNTSVSL